MTSSVIQSIVPALCGSFVGAWSDRFGRKPLLIASFIGYEIDNLIYFLKLSQFIVIFRFLIILYCYRCYKSSF